MVAGWFPTQLRRRPLGSRQGAVGEYHIQGSRPLRGRSSGIEQIWSQPMNATPVAVAIPPVGTILLIVLVTAIVAGLVGWMIGAAEAHRLAAKTLAAHLTVRPR